MTFISNHIRPVSSAKSHIPSPSRGLTLIEILVAMVMTFIVLYAMMEAFQYANGEISRGRAIIEMSNQIRSAQEIMRRDFDDATVPLRPHSQTTLPNGYFEIVEGPRRDVTGTYSTARAAFGYLGDVDDIVSFTVSRPDRPFRGRWVNASGAIQIVESSLAEVVWWTSFSDRNQNGQVDYEDSVTLFRRVLLIRPDLPTYALTNFLNINEFRSLNDLSCRYDGTNMIANTLTDLGVRRNRFCHDPSLNIAPDPSNPLDRADLLGSRMSVGMSDRATASGEDIILTNISGFDAKVFSPMARVDTSQANLVVQPGDLGFAGSAGPLGAYADLGYLIRTQNDPLVTAIATDYDNLAEPPPFGHVFLASDAYQPFGQNALDSDFGWWPKGKSRCYYPNPFGGVDLVYDVWTPVYESDGINQDGDAITDQGTNGLDDDAANGVDDNGERETLPPYETALRGIKVSFRLIEKRSRQVRQTSVIHSFVPE